MLPFVPQGLLPIVVGFNGLPFQASSFGAEKGETCEGYSLLATSCMGVIFEILNVGNPEEPSLSEFSFSAVSSGR